VEVVEKVAKTVGEAVTRALTELGVDEQGATIEVLEEPSKGLFGLLGSRPARVRVTKKDSLSLRARQLLNKIFHIMKLSVNIEIIEKNTSLRVNLSGDGLGVLIGRRGETLDALQYLLNLYINKNREQKCKVIIDVEGYRKRREQTLERLACKLAEKAKQKGRSIVLEPMNSQERRVIHTALQGREDIYTHSEGEEPYRKIIISPRK